ncbi:MAG: hypothetical protein ACJAZ5_002115 [Alloalcanivorax venustensis]
MAGAKRQLGAIKTPLCLQVLLKETPAAFLPLFRAAPNFFVTERRRRPLFFLSNARAARLRGEGKGAPGHHGESVVKRLSCVIVF